MQMRRPRYSSARRYASNELWIASLYDCGDNFTWQVGLLCMMHFIRPFTRHQNNFGKKIFSSDCLLQFYIHSFPFGFQKLYFFPFAPYFLYDIHRNLLDERMEFYIFICIFRSGESFNVNPIFNEIFLVSTRFQFAWANKCLRSEISTWLNLIGEYDLLIFQRYSISNPLSTKGRWKIKTTYLA